MKAGINKVLQYLVFEKAEMSIIRDRFMSPESSQPGFLKKEELKLQDAIKEINTQSHRDLHTYYFFMGCVFYEQDKHKEAVACLENAIIGAWHSRTNRSLIRWQIALIYIDQKDFPKARLELDEALKLLDTSASINSLRADTENGNRQPIREGIIETQEKLAGEPFLRDVPPAPPGNKDISSTQQTQETAGNASNTPGKEDPAQHETFTGKGMDFPPWTETSSEIPDKDTAGINSTDQTRTDGYLSIISLPVYEQNVAASKPGVPLSPLEKNGFAETRIIILENRQYRIHSMKRNDNKIKVLQNTKMGWVKVAGKSMNRIPNRTSIEDGDYVLSRFTSIADDNDIVLASLEDPQTNQIRLVVKRYRRERQVLQSETTEKGMEYGEIDMQETNNSQIIGVVLAVAKPLN